MWVQITIWVITTVIGMLLTPKPPKPAAETPGRLEEPVAESGKAIPVLFGTRVAVVTASAGLGTAVLHAWTEADQALWAGVLSFWFLGRVFDRVRS